MQCECVHSLKERGIEFSELTQAQKFAELQRIAGKRITLWLKRVRKNSGAVIRYLLVAERHKTGLPHYHLLVHEMGGVVRHRHLADSWSYGFTNFKLVLGGRPASYVAKYLGKSHDARVRASLGYGQFLRPRPQRTTGERENSLSKSTDKWSIDEIIRVWNELSSELQNGARSGKSETGFQGLSAEKPDATPAKACQRQFPPAPEACERQFPESFVGAKEYFQDCGSFCSS